MKRKVILTELVIIVFAFGLVLSGVTSAQSGIPIIAIDPGLSSHTPAATFVLNVTISGVTLENTGGYGVCAWQVNVNFSSIVLNAVSVAEGPWLKAAGTTRQVSLKIDNSTNPGTVVVSYSLFPLKTSGALGSGTLCSITFQVMNNGRSDLYFSKTSLRAYTGSGYLVLDHSLVNGYFQHPQGEVYVFASGKAYGSTGGPPPSTNWNHDVDFDHDNNVDKDDLIILSDNYGED